MKKIFDKYKFISVFFAALIVAVASSIIVVATSYHTVRINYYYIDGTPAHDPYIATFTAGNPVDFEVKNPSIDGFVPMSINEGDNPSVLPEGGTEEKKSVFKMDSVEQDVTKNIYYVAGLTHYAARYYKQNLYDDLYTLDSELTEANKNLYGYTGESPTSLEKVKIDGFTNLFHEPDAIAADGSTVFKVYYDRNYYSITFDLGSGGYGVEPVYAKYQTVFRIEEPKRVGYSFLGWARTDKDSSDGEYGKDWHYIDADGNIIDEAEATAVGNLVHLSGEQKVPHHHSHYKAVWEVGKSSFSIVYWVENANDNGYSVVAAKDVHNYANGSQVMSGNTVNPDTEIKTASGKTIKAKEFFSYNLNSAAKDNAHNENIEPDAPHYDSDDNVIDFNDISGGQSDELSGKDKFYQLNEPDDTSVDEAYRTDSSVKVAGDGTSHLNIFFKRKQFKLKFFYARQKLNKGVADGPIDLTNSTKSFSNQGYSGTAYMQAIEKGTWKNDIADSLPHIEDRYKTENGGILDELYEDYKGYRYSYYQVNAKYNSSLDGKWLIDAITGVHKKGYAEEEVLLPGSWAVENGTNYYNSHKSVKNYTIKGFYEKLGNELMFSNDVIKQNKVADFTELHYLLSWTNTSTGPKNNDNSWNYGINRVLHFRYENFVELLPCELDKIEEAKGENKEEKIRNFLETDNTYEEIREFETIVDGVKTTKTYGLMAVNIIETTDSGDQYDRNKSLKDRNANVRKNQTSSDITGFEIENRRLDNSTKQIILDDSNTEIDWSQDSDTNRKATIRFFYRRRLYTLNYRNGNKKENEVPKRLPYNSPLNYRDAEGNYSNYYENPQYFIESLKGYYSFAGWYTDPKFDDNSLVDKDVYRMPADDDILYAKWVPKTIDVTFYNDYNDFYMDRDPIVLGHDEDDNDKEITSWSVDYGSYTPLMRIPVDDENPENPRPKLHPIAKGATFAGWYYIRNRLPVRFEPENVPVTAMNDESAGENGKLRLFAEWVTKDVAKYKVNYVEKDNPENQVADPTTGRAFVSKTKTFNAKSADELDDEHKWTAEGTEEGKNWWPTINSHSIVVKPNAQGAEFAPNEFTFEYVQKSSVHYKVQYLDAATRYPINPTHKDIIKESTHASVKEDAMIIPGYVAREASQTLVLTASTNEDREKQKSEELAYNVITFLYDKNDTDYLYEVEYYTQNIDNDDYSLYYNETLTVPIESQGETTVSVADLFGRAIPEQLTSHGFAHKAGSTIYTSTDSEGTSEPISVADKGTITCVASDKKTIKIYFDRLTYNYSYRYIDHTQEKLYNDMVKNGEDVTGVWNGVLADYPDAGSGRTDCEITINPAEYVSRTADGKEINYVRIGKGEVKLTIQPSGEQNPDINLVKIYYRTDTERELSYKMVCVNENSVGYESDTDPVTNEPLFGRLSFNMQTVQSYDDIQDVTFFNNNDEIVEGSGASAKYLHDHRYTFLGWYTTPEYDENNPDANRITTNEVLTKADIGNTLPEKDTKYYALVSQDMVYANVEYRYLDGYSKEDFRELSDKEATPVVADASTDPNGNRVGEKVVYSAPSQYENNTPIAWHRSDGYSLRLDPADGRVYKYEFAEWWELEEKQSSKKSSGEESNLIRKTNWNSSDEWYSSSLSNVIARTKDQHLIALFTRRVVEELPYTIHYKFKTRSGEEKSYVVKGTLKGDELIDGNAKVQITRAGAFELTDDYIFTLAPFESNHGETLCWTDKQIEKTSVRADGSSAKESEQEDRMITYVTAKQDAKSVFANYRLTADGDYTPIKIPIGANRETDKQLQALDLRGNKDFSYWSIRKSADGDEIARCYDALFSFCMMDNYWITPVFEGEKDKTDDLTTVTLKRLGYSRNRWTDEDGNIPSSGETDILLTDFEISFNNKDKEIYGENSGYKTGIVLELCAQLPAGATFNHDRDYGFVSDETNLVEAIKKNASVYYYKEGKRRSISVNNIPTENLTNKNRVEFYKGYKNAYKQSGETRNYTNKTYVMKATAYLIDKDGNATLSNSVYVCLNDIANQEMAVTGMCTKE